MLIRTPETMTPSAEDNNRGHEKCLQLVVEEGMPDASKNGDTVSLRSAREFTRDVAPADEPKSPVMTKRSAHQQKQGAPTGYGTRNLLL